MEARRYRCSDCGTVWKRAVPKWNGWVAVVFGGLFLSYGVTGVSPEQTTGFAIGLGLITYGILLLRGKAGKLEVEAPAPPPAKGTSEQKPQTSDPKRFEKATTGDIILSVILPGWGILIGLMALCKGEKQRAKTMMGIGACLLVALILIGFLRAIQIL